MIDDYEEEEDEVFYRPRFYRPRVNFNLPTPTLFRESFRVDWRVVEVIEGIIGRFIERPTRRSHALSAREQILITLHFLGNGSIYHLNGYSLGVTKATICQCIHTVCELITRYIMPLYVRRPTNNTNNISEKFARICGFPHVKGLSDGTLININAPSVHEPVYVSRTHKHAINLLLVSGPQHEFFYASAKCPGSFHDSRCLQVSSLWNSWELNQWRPGDDRSIILGDSAFPLTTWLITPTIRVSNRLPHLENAIKIFLQRHRKTRFKIECAIGILKHQFYYLRYGLRFTDPRRICLAIYACVTLHNMQNYSKHGCYDYDADLNRIAQADYDDMDREDIDEDDDPLFGVAVGVGGAARQRELIEYFLR